MQWFETSPSFVNVSAWAISSAGFIKLLGCPAQNLILGLVIFFFHFSFSLNPCIYCMVVLVAAGCFMSSWGGPFSHDFQGKTVKKLSIFVLASSSDNSPHPCRLVSCLHGGALHPTMHRNTVSDSRFHINSCVASLFLSPVLPWRLGFGFGRQLEAI